jgi:alpha-tubulin suppressor-like RCC1 family protein
VEIAARRTPSSSDPLSKVLVLNLRRHFSALVICVAVILCAPAPAAPQQPGAGEPLQFVTLTAGSNFTCGLTRSGAAYCWGENEMGALGFESPEDCRLEHRRGPCSRLPRPVAGGLVFTSLDASMLHMCGLIEDGQAYCWGSNQLGQLGARSGLVRCPGVGAPPPFLLDSCALAPVAVDTEQRFISLSAGNELTCGLTAEGETYCWGRSGFPADSTIHGVRRAAGDRHFVAISADYSEPCALEASGDVYCWSDWAGALPTLVDAPAPFTRVSTGFRHACALTAAGDAYCWGENVNGELGTGQIGAAGQRSPQPNLVAGGHRFREIHAGFFRTCGVTVAEALYCWGWMVGPRGITRCSTTNNWPGCAIEPVLVTDGRFGSIALGQVHNCALDLDGVGYCWGRRRNGNFGDGEPDAMGESLARTVWRAATPE